VYFCLSFYYSFIPVITLHYHSIPALAEYQAQVYSTLLFFPATQTYFSEGEDGLEFFDKEFYATCCVSLRVFRYSVSLRVIIVFSDTIYVIIIILYL
jgi:hypothetical protein